MNPMNQKEDITSIGTIKIEVRKNGHQEERIEEIFVKNTVLQTGREALARSLANDYGEIYQFYIHRMLFGNGGTEGGIPVYVNVSRNGLFGTTLLSKPVSCSIDPNFTSQVVFTSVVTFDEAIGETINEMAMQMSNGDLYSMATFGDISKSGAMQITFSWRCSFI